MGNNISYQQKHCEVNLDALGRLRGLQYDNKARRFAGVPYALPPLGQHRWRKPRPLPQDYCYSPSKDEAFDATAFHPPCWQKGFISVAEQGSGNEVHYSEDCLRLNIWTPVHERPDKTAPKWPVYVWLHGGWFQLGDPSQEPGMDPTELISEGGLKAIVIAVGYRLNVFGFLASEILREESDGAAAGNYGLWDQKLALEWIQHNISAFGGDVNNVTLAGRSAGAYGVHAQVLHSCRAPRPESRRLFDRFFMCSNAIPAQPKSVAETQEQFDELCHKLDIDLNLGGVEKLSRLRDVPAASLVETIGSMEHHTFRPVTDNVFIHDNLIDYHTSGQFAAKFRERNYRLLIGEVLNEETLYATYNAPKEPTIDALKIQIQNYYAKPTTDRVMSHYSLPQSQDLKSWCSLFGDIVADGQVRAPTRLVVDSLLSNGVDIKDVWRYQVAYRLSFINEKIAPKDFGVSHAMDKPFWNFSVMHGPPEDEAKLMKDWIEGLSAFVQDDRHYNYGTNAAGQFKVVTPEGKIEIREDQRYHELVELAHVFAGTSSQ